jgi:aminoglycoside phosphotransferase (APT) family kinase protein
LTGENLHPYRLGPEGVPHGRREALTAVDVLVPPGPLAAWLDEHLDDGLRGPVQVTPLGSGRSNLTFTVRRGSRSYVLRRPPRGELPETAHDMLREYRVLRALASTPVRAPRPILACSDPAVLGVPFYLMEVVDGVVIRDAVPAAFPPSSRRALGTEMVDALAELHLLDHRAAGLADLGRPDGYTARQVRRWTRQWAVMQTRTLPDVEAVRAWLDANVPTTAQAAVVHGDYKMDNVVFGPAPPARLRAILDWEMATLGDPLADLGYLLVFWPQTADEEVRGLRTPTTEPGFPTRAEVVERYEQRTGFATAGLHFYRTLALWKLAILSEGLYKRYLSGGTDDPWYAHLETSVPRMAALARAWCGA